MATLFRLFAYLSPPSAAATGIRTPPVSAVARWDPSADADASAARQLEIEPLDASNARLLDAVHPRRWTDPSPPEVYDLVVIGAGAGGLVSAKQAARRGARSCLISEALAGGDCLNVGCVPSKALLRAARAVREVRRAEEFGVRLSAPPAVDFAAVMQRLRAKRAQIAPADSHEGTNAAGADVYQGRGRFTGRNTVEVNGKVLRFRKAVIATGGRAALPPIPGLETAPFLTNANLFNLDSLPPRLAVLGAGAVALEMAHAFSAFGSAVTVLARSGRLLPREHPKAGEAVAAALREAGVTVRYNATVERVAHTSPEADGFPRITLHAVGGGGGGEAAGECDGGGEEGWALECDALLVATGREPNTGDLGLDAAGVEAGEGGILVDELLATSNPDVYAAGDVVSGTPRLTHVAGEHAKVAVENALFGGAWRHTSLVVPSVIYTEPEVAMVGMSLAAARAAGVEVEEYSSALAGNDRAILEGEDEEGGFVSILCRRGGDEIVGATVVGSRAGEAINELTLAIHAKVGLAAVARSIHPYPTTGEAVMQAALGFVRARWATMPNGDERDS